IEATTETATRMETGQPASGENAPAGASISEEKEWLKAALKAARLERVRLGERLIQLEQDSSAERETNEKLSQKIEAQTTTLEKAKTDFEDLQRQHQAHESKTAGLQKERDELQGKV